MSVIFAQCPFSNDVFLCFAGTELSILMRSLTTKTARDYFATFEREHKCFIDVQKKDNQRTTSTKVLRYFILIQQRSSTKAYISPK